MAPLGVPMRSALFLLGLFGIGAVGACSSSHDSTNPGPTVAAITITPAVPDTLFSIGQTLQLTAVAREASGVAVAGAGVGYETSAPSVVTISPDGLITAVGNGTATVTGSSGTIKASVPVVVRQKLAKAVVSPPSGGVAIGRTLALTATGQDARGNPITGLSRSFVSDNTAAARVDAAGVVTGVAIGTANVTATVSSSSDGARTATAAITVSNAPPATATVTLGATTFAPASTEIAVGGTVTWVNDSGVAHDVDFGTQAMHIPVFDSGQRSLAFATAGTFEYHCNIHAGMTGTVVVR